MSRGGKRKGAGRPRGDAALRFKSVSVSLSPELLTLLDSYAKEKKISRSAAIEQLCLVGISSSKKS